MSVFSDREQKVINILGRKRKTLGEISDEVFKKVDKPFDSVIAVGNSISRIIKKCDHYDLHWTLVKTRENNKLTIKKEKR